MRRCRARLCAMFFLGPLLLFFLILPLLFLLVFFNLATISFARLGLSPEAALAFFLASAAGSVINIPVSRERVVVPRRVNLPFFLFYYPPTVEERVICLNVGGALLPAALSLYLLATVSPFLPAVLATAAVALLAKAMARPVPGVGIAMPAFIPPLLAAACALLLARENPAPVAYISGTMGTLIGADLLNYRIIRRLGAQAVSIGGAGIFDGIFLVGIVAAFLS